MQLTREEEMIHEAALRAGHNFVRAEWPLIQSLQNITRTKLHKKFGKKSAKAYATHFFGLSDSVAEIYSRVAKKAVEVSELNEALASRKITVGKASRILSVINSVNAKDLIEFASKSSDRKVDLEVGRINPRALPKDNVKVLSDTHVLVMTAMTIEDFDKLKRVESLEAQKQKPKSLGNLIGLCLKTHLEKHDPVRKAKRAKPRASTAKEGRRPNAAQTHAVNLRDEGRCTFEENGERCNSDRWVHKHHIHEYAKGVSNDSENLQTLCSFHHDFIHSGEERHASITYL